MPEPYVLGIWDGHDSGAALLRGDSILCAVNEERLSRRKLDVTFPKQAIHACLQAANLRPDQVDHVAASTTDFAKTLTRLFPGLKEQYYLIRRRKIQPSRTMFTKKRFKYRMTEFSPTWLTRLASTHLVRKELARIGIQAKTLRFFDHHYCHAIAAALTCNWDQALVLTLDGLGDGVSGTASILKNSRLDRIVTLPARHSLGIFFEHVTNLLNMRELEDEGKVMALASHCLQIPDSDNPLLSFFCVKALQIRCAYSSLWMFDELRKIIWRFPPEQFAYMAQRTLEVVVTTWVQEVISATGIHKLALSGGVASNIKLNRLLRLMPDVEDCYVFPHMGDGGLAIGAAMALAHEVRPSARFDLGDLRLGPTLKLPALSNLSDSYALAPVTTTNVDRTAAELISKGAIIAIVRGRSELGPRALGGRSIVTCANSLEAKDRLNVRLKKRVWYQPFCPAILSEDAEIVFDDYDGHPNQYMTMGYTVRREFRAQLCGVISADGSCRPQIVTSPASPFWDLLQETKRITGFGVILNTSFNVHGQPLVCSATDAIEAFKAIGLDYLLIEESLWRPRNQADGPI